MATQVSNFLRKCSATAIGSGRNYMYMLSRVSYSDSIGPRRIPPPKKLSTPLLPPLPYNHSAKRFITGGTGGYVYAIIEFIANYKDVWGGLASAAKFIADYRGRSHLIKCIREGVSSIEERISSIEERISKSAPEIGPDAPGIFTCVIQISKGTKVKYSHDKKSGLIKVDRVLHSSVLYPHNYGVIPRTLRPIGVLIIMQDPVLPGCILRAKAIGLMPMIDKGERDDKILAVGADDPEYQDFKDIDELPPHLLTEVRSFFENEEVAVDEFLPVAKAHEAIQVSMDLYGATFKR